MRSQQPQAFKAYLWLGSKKIPVEAKYASKFSFLVKFLNGHRGDQNANFKKIVFQKNSDTIEMGPCQYLAAKEPNAYQGQLVFNKDVYDLSSLFFKNKIDKLQSEFAHLPLVLAHKDKITRKFQDFTANLTYDLNIYKNLFDELDMRYQDEPDTIKQHVQRAIIDTEGRKFMSFLDDTLEEFESVIINFNKKEHECHGFYLRKQIWNFIMCSPFMARTNLKPRGYSGDSAMMKMIYDNDYEGESTFGKLMHKHPNEHPAAQAVRNRRKLIAEMLAGLRNKNKIPTKNKLKVLSVACGPAFELQDVITSAENCAGIHFTLLDQDKSALSEARSQIKHLEQKFDIEITVDYLNESVRTMLTTPKLETGWGQFDYIYSMGLFDYLTPPVAKALLTKLYQILKVGGEMAIGNFHISNASRYYMEYWLDWVLYYRTEQEFLDLLKNEHSAETSVIFEDTGSQMFLHVKKYDD